MLSPPDTITKNRSIGIDVSKDFLYFHHDLLSKSSPRRVPNTARGIRPLILLCPLAPSSKWKLQAGMSGGQGCLRQGWIPGEGATSKADQEKLCDLPRLIAALREELTGWMK